MTRNSLLAWLLLLSIHSLAAAADWAPAKGPLSTRWAKDVTPERVLPEYPRPQLVRTEWTNLNGLWQLAIGKEGDEVPIGKDLPETILVPFPVESALSGVMKRADRLWYRRTFETPAKLGSKRLLLHFGAVDWESTVWVNGRKAGAHQGGYDGFSFDITDALKPGRDQELIVRVYDPTNKSFQPRGKQVDRPEGIYYTPTTGIWQTVWLEPVPQARVQSLKISTPNDLGEVVVDTQLAGEVKGLKLSVTATDRTEEVASATTSELSGRTTQRLAIAKGARKLWTPETPFLYGLRVELKDGDRVVDSITSYFGLRKIEIAKDAHGINRIHLNGKPIFQVGPLDQGFWPDGLYTAPTDEALKYDIEITKKLGFNMTRKHVKVEPDRWYYWCDRLGLLVWQDMPSGEKSINPGQPDMVRSAESAKQYEVELKAMIDGLHNHPSIVTWVVFNEGWGQFDTARIADWTKKYDPSRLINSASGWQDRGVGDLHDWHVYPGPAAPPIEEKRAVVLGEFGGLSLGSEGHQWADKIWGYASTASKEELTRKYERLIRGGWKLGEEKGLCALVYTQITDVETEANGLLTYDRAVIKVDLERAAAVNRGEFSKMATYREIAPTAREREVEWSYSTETPAANWFETQFDATSWKKGKSGFGSKGTPGAIIRTEWTTSDIWVRRQFDLGDVKPGQLTLAAHHDEDTEIYLNGVLAAKLRGHVSSYQEEIPISAEALATLKKGQNSIAVHCHQTQGGQFIDAGLIEIVPSKP